MIEKVAKDQLIDWVIHYWRAEMVYLILQELFQLLLQVHPYHLEVVLSSHIVMDSVGKVNYVISA